MVIRPTPTENPCTKCQLANGLFQRTNVNLLNCAALSIKNPETDEPPPVHPCPTPGRVLGRSLAGSQARPESDRGRDLGSGQPQPVAGAGRQAGGRKSFGLTPFPASGQSEVNYAAGADGVFAKTAAAAFALLSVIFANTASYLA